MRKWPWWVWAAIGLVCGAAVTAALLEWTRIDHAEIWRAATAMQGWVGAVVGAVVGAAGAFGAAFFVLQRTLADERARFEQQRAAEDRRFSEQRALEDARFAAQRIEDNRRLRRQLRESKMQADRAERSQRRSQTEQKRIEMWAEFIALVREYFRFPVDDDAFSMLEHRTTAAFFRWSLYMPPEAQGTVDGVDVVLSRIIASARGDVREVRRRGGAATHLRSQADDLIAKLVRHGNDLHRGGTAADDAAVWFQERVDEAPWHFADRS